MMPLSAFFSTLRSLTGASGASALTTHTRLPPTRLGCAILLPKVLAESACIVLDASLG